MEHAAATSRVKPQARPKPRKQPPYNVILVDDDDHTYEYVIEMLMAIFAFSERKGYEHTVDVDTNGHTRLLTCGLSEAEAKRDKIHAYGADPRLDRSLGSMAALIEPAA